MDIVPATLLATVVVAVCDDASDCPTPDAMAPIALIGASETSVIDEGVELLADPGPEPGPPMELGMEFIGMELGGMLGPMELCGGMEFGMELGAEE